MAQTKDSRVITALDAVTSTTTSSAIDISLSTAVTVFCTRANHSAGSSTFTVDISADGSTWVTVATLIGNSETSDVVALVPSLALSSNTSDFVVLSRDLIGTAKEMRVKATIATDGDATAKVVISEN